MTGLQLSREELLKAYRLMRMIRVFEDRVSAEMASGDIPGNTHLYAGQEASAVGICLHLSESDRIASTHRGHGHCIAKGCDVDGMMAEIFGKDTGICRGKGGSMHIADLSKGMLGANGIVGGAPPIACGAALTSQILGRNDVSVAFTGDGGINQGTTAESMNLAQVWKLPVIFAVEDNGFGEATASSFVVAGEITKRAEALGMAFAKVDGVDFFAVHEAAGEAVERARRGEGPTLLHIETPRYYGHFSGDPDNYRTAEEKAAMRRDRDCLPRFRRRVTEAKLLGLDELDKVDAEVQAAIDQAVASARSAPQPALSSLTTDVYVRY
ncbi:thiamine pyrophosphate-dependent dehydrogenase E1 component subunit alpha [Aestuariivirga sp. YIM B02566]|uniref:Thiamine pyrophosphate-dependent dehydrogenase E1 component subunit alpha n=1 Tax=Taklimakanibacter albus TaxID=2800327 RepID=A0ACC5R773_9HYPH|nr:thiamine pyrophosphate-dependent dehydrogenase E1 component subunit alpha [Aestuariivirga sp. YIM B02566]MBK1868412.1 thiamine pyrophosphate-dependent dehydrogenase E1 component subunit alpha [Aestuariivirga sp. YIM B02566]